MNARFIDYFVLPCKADASQRAQRNSVGGKEVDCFLETFKRSLELVSAPFETHYGLSLCVPATGIRSKADDACMNCAIWIVVFRTSSPLLVVSNCRSIVSLPEN